MKILLYLLFTLISPSEVYAQISITNSDMPSSGDTIRYSTASLSGFSFIPTQTGTNYTWDFSNLSPAGQGIYEYKNSFSTPYFFYFINKMGLKTLDSIPVVGISNIFTFYTKSTSVFKTEGLGYSYSGIPLANNYLDEDEIYQFPLNFGDRDSSTFYFNFDLSAITTALSYSQSGYRINEVDGWGSITTPNGNYPNTLRVKSTIYTMDSIEAFGFPLNTGRTTVEYKWLSNTEKIPVLEVRGTQSGSNFIVNSVRYRDKNIITALTEPDLETEVSISPNPVINSLHIRFSKPAKYQIHLLNAAGRILCSFQSMNNPEILDMSSFQPGVYFLSVSETGSSRNRIFRLVKK